MTYAVGLMAGTSLDGVDAALIKITPHSQKSKQVSVRLCDWITRSYPQELKSRLLTLSYVPSEKYKNKQPRDPLSDLCELNFLLGEFFAKTTLALLKKNNRSPEKISFIGSHGQTIRHLGSRGTLQIGEPSVIAEKTGILTVADFRPRDIAAGGHGAPLTPYVNALLFRDAKKARVIQNIGGIGNVTYLPPGEGFKGVTGFDTGPGNMLIDGLMRHFTQGRRHYDEDGRFAGKGWVCLKLLHQWMTEPFLNVSRAMFRCSLMDMMRG